MIEWQEIGVDEDLARQILVLGRSTAPCIASFSDTSEERKDAIAVLRRVYKRCVRPEGSEGVKGQSQGPSRVDYLEISSAFDGDTGAALRALCSSGTPARLPVGSFPTDLPISRLWPETP